jgi:hypothetical protein
MKNTAIRRSNEYLGLSISRKIKIFVENSFDLLFRSPEILPPDPESNIFVSKTVLATT